MRKKRFAFTLVELIIVIVIIAILGTISTLTFRDYPRQSRNAVRTTDLANISKSLEIYYTQNGKYPDPENISSSSNLGRLDGKLETDLQNTLKIKVQDPKTNEAYSYSLVQTKDAYKLKAEDSEKEHISDSKAKEITLTNINKISTNVYINDDTGYIFKKIKKDWPDSNCSLNDIEVYTPNGDLLQTWAGCNSTLGNGSERGMKADGTLGTIDTSDGCYNYSGVNLDLSMCEGNSNYMKSSDNAKDFFNLKVPSGKNQSLDIEFETIWGKLYSWEKANSGACPNGWRLPDKNDYKLILEGLNCNDTISNDNWICEGLGWEKHSNNLHSEYNNLTNLFYIPLGGYGDLVNNVFSHRGNRTCFWLDNKNYMLLTQWSESLLFNTSSNINDLNSVRCIKK